MADFIDSLSERDGQSVVGLAIPTLRDGRQAKRSSSSTVDTTLPSRAVRIKSVRTVPLFGPTREARRHGLLRVNRRGRAFPLLSSQPLACIINKTLSTTDPQTQEVFVSYEF